MGDAKVRGGYEGKVLVLELGVDHLDAANAVSFKTQAAALAKGADRVVLDLDGVQFIDSAGLGALLSIMRVQAEKCGDFRLCRASKAVKLLFELVRLEAIIELHENREAAIAASLTRNVPPPL